jgi:murein DD-endopeptidase MepM/ murein hydrolase activator NlpD
MRTVILLVAMLILSPLAAGCNGAPADLASDQVVPEFTTFPENTELPGQASTPVPATSTVVVMEIKVADSPSATAEKPRELEICSPLGEHLLTALPEIVSSAYTAPPVGREERHHGVDFSYYRSGDRESIAGESIQAILDGRVALVLKDSFPYGNAVILETRISDLPEAWSDMLAQRIEAYQAEVHDTSPLSIYFLYAHLQNATALQAGQQVHACTLLGAVGKSGNAGVAHLHLEMRLGVYNAILEEMGYYLYEITPQQREAYLRWRTSGEFRHFDPMLLLAAE